MKALILKLIGEENAGRLDYLLKRKSKHAWGPLNGQNFRQLVYSEIMSKIPFQAIVETGTYLGTTTDYFAKSGLPVYTVELLPRFYGFAAQRFSGQKDRVHVYKGNSPEFLNALAKDPTVPKSKVFFYLDAHVQDPKYHKAPLVEELEIVFAQWTDAVVLVDDFQVPGTAYSFDDWGPGKTLSLECLEPLHHLNLTAYFPTLDPKLETGAKRGWVVLCREEAIARILGAISNLRPAANQPAG